jgi:serine phosphatase RsbU (regulator of sigma subunit)
VSGDGHDAAQSLEPLAPVDARDGHRTLLLVEDDAGDALIVEALLADAWPGLEIIHVRTLAEAEVSLAGSVDCVVLDLGLPDARGMSALARIRAAAPETAVVVLTGDTDQGRGIQALSAGAQDYVVKGDIRGESFARIIGYSIQRKESELAARELAVLRVQTAENTRVQRGLVPHPLLEDDRIAIRSAYHPGNRRQVLGGDFFDVVQTGPDCLHAVLGDVCGRGPDEAALGVQLRIAWRTLTLAEVDQQTVLRILDHLTATERHADHIFATMASIRIDLATGAACVALAGHPSPVIAGGGKARLLVDRVGGPPLGVGAQSPWRIAEVDLGPSWTLLFYSDGVYEGHVRNQVHRLGLEGLVEMLSECEAQGSFWEELPDPLIHRVEALNDGPLPDDVALLGLRFDGERA